MAKRKPSPPSNYEIANSPDYADCYRRTKHGRSYVDQCGALTIWRQRAARNLKAVTP